MLCVELNLTFSSKTVISAIYRPPDSTPSYDFHSVTEFTSHLKNSARFLKSHSLILGDFNYPAVKWIEGCGFSNSMNSADSAFCETLQDHSLLQVNPPLTRKENILDLLITDAPDRIMNIATLTPIQAGLETDHDLLEFDFVARPRRVKKPARYAYNFKSADFENLKRQIMQRSAISNSVSCNSGVDACWPNWKSAVLDIINADIPKARVRDSNRPPWIDKEVRRLLKRKESARRAAKKHNSTYYLEKFRILRKESKALINRKLKEYHTSLGDSLKVNPKRFWSYFRHKTKSKSIPVNVVYGGGQISSGVEMAEAFNKYFYSMIMHASEVPLDAFTLPDGRMLVLDSLVLCEDEVYKVLLNLDPSKAPGPDGLPTIVLKTCARELTPSLCALFNLSLAEGKLPTEWKHAFVVPVHKKGKKEDVTNYRPISLLCIASKVLEGCIFKHFKDFPCPLFDNAQHGFLQGRSTVTQLLAFYHEIGQSLDKGLQSDIVYLDLAKAFDSVSHQRLLLKHSHYGVSGKLLQWFESYLGGCGQQCLVHGFTSSRSPVPSGVLQGSILGPLLFLVYVNDLLLVIQNRIALFADDSKCSSVIESLQDCESLQKDLESLHGWSDNWHLKFNTSKCEVLTVTHKRHPFHYDYKLNNNSLKYVTKVKDLGVTISPDLTWDTHINTILAKANRMLAFLHRNSAMSFTTGHRNYYISGLYDHILTMLVRYGSQYDR